VTVTAQQKIRAVDVVVSGISIYLFSRVWSKLLKHDVKIVHVRHGSLHVPLPFSQLHRQLPLCSEHAMSGIVLRRRQVSRSLGMEAVLRESFNRVLLVVIAVLLAVIALQPYVTRTLAPAVPPPVVPRADLAAGEKTTIEIFQRVSPSVVQVVSVPNETDGRAMLQQDDDGSGGGGGGQSGTGFVWDAAGHVVTNNHVVEGVRAVAVRLASGQVVPAEVVGRAPNYDLAVLRLRGGAQLPAAVAIGKSADLQVGQAAFAIGNPFGLDQSLTTGVISALKRRLPTAGGRELTDVVQTDAAINPGNSGGPLLDSAGRVIGVNTAIFSPSGTNAGIGFAIPIDSVSRVVPALIRDGRVPTPGIGIVAADEALATRLGVHGVIVVRTTPGSPAARAGLRGVNMNTGELGDVIVGVNGKPVRRLADLTAELEVRGVGKSVDIELQRAGRNDRITMNVADITPRQ
jgi:2-alkenal reductase